MSLSGSLLGYTPRGGGVDIPPRGGGNLVVGCRYLAYSGSGILRRMNFEEIWGFTTSKSPILEVMGFPHPVLHYGLARAGSASPGLGVRMSTFSYRRRKVGRIRDPSVDVRPCPPGESGALGLAGSDNWGFKSDLYDVPGPVRFSRRLIR